MSHASGIMGTIINKTTNTPWRIEITAGQVVYSGFLELFVHLPAATGNDAMRAVRVNQNRTVAGLTAKQ